MIITPQTETLRKDLAQIWNVQPFRVDVRFVLGRLEITVDGRSPSEEQLAAFRQRIETTAAEKRRSMN